MRLLFQLGRTPELSIAEIARLAALHGAEVQNPFQTPNSLTFEVERMDACLEWVGELGGTIRVARELTRLDSLEAGDVVDTWLAADSLDDVPPGRCAFGWSCLADPFAMGDDADEYGPMNATLRKYIRSLCEHSKDRLGKDGRSVRFLLPRDDSTVPWLTSAQSGEARLAWRGRDIVIARDDAGMGLYRTVWLQDYRGQSWRDYERPHRDPTSGMLPPQLSRILVNLARDPERPRLLDPFCGDGGILAEAILLGQKIVGADRDFEAVRHARDNIEWLTRPKKKKERKGAPKRPPEKEAVDLRDNIGPWIQSDVRTLRRVLEPLDISAVVTEPYLGPPQKGALSVGAADTLLEELTDLYVEALAEIRTLVRPGGRVVFVLPAFQVRGKKGRTAPAMGRELKLLGYRRLDPYNGLDLESPKQLEYSRTGQTVGRRILLLEA